MRHVDKTLRPAESRFRSSEERVFTSAELMPASFAAPHGETLQLPTGSVTRRMVRAMLSGNLPGDSKNQQASSSTRRSRSSRELGAHARPTVTLTVTAPNRTQILPPLQSLTPRMRVTSAHQFRFRWHPIRSKQSQQTKELTDEFVRRRPSIFVDALRFF